MQVQFNRPVTLKGITYGVGQHHVPDLDVKGDWFFNSLVDDGAAIILTQETPAVYKDLQADDAVQTEDVNATNAAHEAEPLAKSAARRRGK